MEIFKKEHISDITPEGICHVSTRYYTMVGEYEVSLSGHPDYRDSGTSYTPLQQEKAGADVDPETFRRLQAIWTPEVIAAYEAKIAAMQAAMAPPAPEPEEPEQTEND